MLVWAALLLPGVRCSLQHSLSMWRAEWDKARYAACELSGLVLRSPAACPLIHFAPSHARRGDHSQRPAIAAHRRLALPNDNAGANAGNPPPRPPQSPALHAPSRVPLAAEDARRAHKAPVLCCTRGSRTCRTGQCRPVRSVQGRELSRAPIYRGHRASPPSDA